jgi:hypothetical protein
MRKLTTTAELIEELGGINAVAELTRSRYSAVCNWKAFPTFPSKTYVVLKSAAQSRGFDVPDSLWGMTLPEDAT